MPCVDTSTAPGGRRATALWRTHISGEERSARTRIAAIIDSIPRLAGEVTRASRGHRKTHTRTRPRRAEANLVLAQSGGYHRDRSHSRTRVGALLPTTRCKADCPQYGPQGPAQANRRLRDGTRSRHATWTDAGFCGSSPVLHHPPREPHALVAGTPACARGAPSHLSAGRNHYPETRAPRSYGTAPPGPTQEAGRSRTGDEGLMALPGRKIGTSRASAASTCLLDRPRTPRRPTLRLSAYLRPRRRPLAPSP